MGHEHDGLLQLSLQVDELLLQSLTGDGIHRAEGLVHQQHGRVPAERPRHTDALTLAARELVGEPSPVLVGVKADQVEQFLHTGVHPGSVPAEEAGHRRHVVRHAPVRKEAALLNDVADAPSQLHRIDLQDVGAVDQDPAA